MQRTTPDTPANTVQRQDALDAGPQTEQQSTTPQYERVLAGDIKRHDRVARARSHRFYEVTRVDLGPTSVRLHYADSGHHDRPRRTAKWWREVTA